MKRALLEHFKTVAAIKRADLAALQRVRGIGPRLAASIHAHLGV
jgi:excinuclease ABC subunit C